MPANNSEIENRLWGAADELRANSKLKSSEYSVPVLGLIFLRYADHKFTLAQKELEGKGTGRQNGSTGDCSNWFKTDTCLPSGMPHISYSKDAHQNKNRDKQPQKTHMPAPRKVSQSAAASFVPRITPNRNHTRSPRCSSS